MRSNSPRLTLIIAAALAAVLAAVLPASAGITLSTVRSAGVVRCGVSEEMAGFSYKDKAGRWQGLSADFCRAVAAAALGDGEKVSFRPLSPASRFPVLLSGSIDLLAHTATVTFGREIGIGVEFAGIYFHDGQTFMAPRKSKVKRVEKPQRNHYLRPKGNHPPYQPGEHLRKPGTALQDPGLRFLDGSHRRFFRREVPGAYG